MHWSEGIRLQIAAITNIGQVTLAVSSKTNLYEILRTCYFFAVTKAIYSFPGTRLFTNRALAILH